jgi:hypothetical protein
MKEGFKMNYLTEKENFNGKIMNTKGKWKKERYREKGVLEGKRKLSIMAIELTF